MTGSYTGTAIITSADIKIEVYRASDFTGSNNVAPIYTQAFTLPRPSNATAWNLFSANGYVQDDPINYTDGSNTINFDTQVQFMPASVSTLTWNQQVDYALTVTHKAANALYYYKVSYMGVTAPAPDDTISGQVGPNVDSVATDSPMAVDSTGINQVYNVSYTLDFTTPSPWQSAYLNQPQFQGTPLPSAYQGKSVDELIHNAPAVVDTLGTPNSSGVVSGLNLIHVDNSPELRDHPILDQFVTSTGSDPMALANYVLNEIDLTDAVGYNTNGSLDDTSINPQGVSRDALATFLEGQGSPTEQCALLVYLLRKAGVPCGYIFPAQDGMLMFDEQLSKLLRMQIRGAEGPSGGSDIPELIPVNYPWVAAFIGFTSSPGSRILRLRKGPICGVICRLATKPAVSGSSNYMMNDPAIRQLRTPDNLYTDDVNVLFPLYVKSQLSGTDMSIDQLGMNIYNRRNYYTNWQDFPRPWQTPAVSNSNLAMNLDVSQNPSGLRPALTNIFDTISIQVISDRDKSGAATALSRS